MTSRRICRYAPAISGTALLVVAAGPAFGQTAPALSPICTDRPTKSNYACTVQSGDFQYESDLLNTAIETINGSTTTTTLFTNPTLKYGLAPTIDLEVNIAPLETVTTSGRGAHDGTIAGVGDLYLRAKYEFLNTDGGALQAAIIPYLKAPTARSGIGNGALEGGAILPINIQLNSKITLTTDPEIDALKDAQGDGRHANTSQLVNLAFSLPHDFTLYGELWGDWNFDPTGTIRQYSADTALAYGITPLLQLDGGINVGLNRATPAAQVYLGISQKF